MVRRGLRMMTMKPVARSQEEGEGKRNRERERERDVQDGGPDEYILSCSRVLSCRRVLSFLVGVAWSGVPTYAFYGIVDYYSLLRHLNEFYAPDHKNLTRKFRIYKHHKFLFLIACLSLSLSQFVQYNYPTASPRSSYP
jgi:hypothetical protein